VVKRIAITMLCVASLSGCASFISSGTGTAPVGTESGARTLGQVFIDSSIVRTAKLIFINWIRALSRPGSILKVSMAMSC